MQVWSAHGVQGRVCCALHHCSARGGSGGSGGEGRGCLCCHAALVNGAGEDGPEWMLYTSWSMNIRAMRYFVVKGERGNMRFTLPKNSTPPASLVFWGSHFFSRLDPAGFRKQSWYHLTHVHILNSDVLSWYLYINSISIVARALTEIEDQRRRMKKYACSLPAGSMGWQLIVIELSDTLDIRLLLLYKEVVLNAIQPREV